MGDSLIVVGDDVVVCVVRSETCGEAIILGMAASLEVELALWEPLPDGRNLYIFNYEESLGENATRHSEVAEIITELLLGS